SWVANRIVATRVPMQLGSRGQSWSAPCAECLGLAPSLADLGPEPSSRFEVTAVARSPCSLRGPATAAGAHRAAVSPPPPAKIGERRTQTSPQSGDETGGWRWHECSSYSRRRAHVGRAGPLHRSRCEAPNGLDRTLAHLRTAEQFHN